MASPAIGTGTGNVQSTTSGSATTIGINAPTSAATGDRLVMAIYTSSTQTITATGWTSIGSIANATLGFELEVFHRTHDGSTTYDPSWGSNASAAGTIMLVTGADSTPIDVSATYQSNLTSATAHTAPTVTTTVADTLLLNFYATALNYTYTPASSQTEVADNQASNGALCVTKLDVAATGATGTKTATCSSSYYWVSMSVAIKPAAATTATTSMIL